jgi:hypothetical protein
MKGAGGTSGGLGVFFLGLIMSISGGFMLTNSIQVSSNFMGQRMNIYGNYGVSTFSVTLIPLLIGIFWLFFDGSSKIGWLFTILSSLAIFIGFIMNLEIYFHGTNLFALLTMLLLLIGGLGLIARSLRSSSSE